MKKHKTAPRKKLIGYRGVPLGTRLLAVFLAAVVIVLVAWSVSRLFLRPGTSPEPQSQPSPAADAANAGGAAPAAPKPATTAPPEAPGKTVAAPPTGASLEAEAAVQSAEFLKTGREALAEGKGHQAVAALQKAAALNPQSSEVWLALVSAHRLNGDLAQAWQTCERALGSIVGDMDDMRRAFARLALDCGKPGKAVEQAQAVLRRLPDDGPANLLAAMGLLRLERSEAALAHARNAAGALPDDPVAQTVLGQSLVLAEQPALALPILQQVLAKVPGDPRASLALARAQRLLGDDAAAEATLARVEQQFDSERLRLVEVPMAEGETVPPGTVGSDLAFTAMAAAERAELLFRSGDPAGAIAAYEKLVAAHPDLASVHYRLAELHLLSGEFEAALKLARGQLVRDPGDPGAHTIQARVFLGRRLPQLAIEHCREALKGEDQTPILLDARKILAMALNRSGQAKEAAAEMRKYLERRPADVDAIVRLSGMLVAVDGPEAALDLVADAVKRFPKAATLPVQESMLLHRLGRDQEATAAMRRAVELGAKGTRVQLSLAALLMEEGQAAAALPMLEEIHEQAPGSHLVSDTLGWCLVELGRLDEAEPHLQAALRALPSAPRYRYHHAVLLQRRQKPAEAVAELRLALASPRQFPERPLAEELLESLAAKQP